MAKKKNLHLQPRWIMPPPCGHRDPAHSHFCTLCGTDCCTQCQWYCQTCQKWYCRKHVDEHKCNVVWFVEIEVQLPPSMDVYTVAYSIYSAPNAIVATEETRERIKRQYPTSYLGRTVECHIMSGINFGWPPVLIQKPVEEK